MVCGRCWDVSSFVKPYWWCCFVDGYCYRFADSLLAGSGRPSWSCSQVVWHTPLLCVQWKTPDGQRNRPKHVEFYSKNKFEKLMHLVGLIIRVLWNDWWCSDKTAQHFRNLKRTKFLLHACLKSSCRQSNGLIPDRMDPEQLMIFLTTFKL